MQTTHTITHTLVSVRDVSNVTNTESHLIAGRMCISKSLDISVFTGIL